jgi:copper chaperone
MKSLDLRIDGMHCGACIRRVTQSLQTIAGAKVEEVRLGAARIELPEGASVDAVIAGLGKAGYMAHQER